MFEENAIEPMRSGEASGWGIWKYHWVSLPVTEDNKYQNVTDDAIEWCKEHYGRMGTRWFEKKKKFFFQSEKDMSLFILKWSS